MKRNIAFFIVLLAAVFAVRGQVHNRRCYNIPTKGASKVSHSQRVPESKIDTFTPKSLKQHVDYLANAMGSNKTGGNATQKLLGEIKGADLLFVSNDKILGDGMMIHSKIEALKELEHILEANDFFEGRSAKEETLFQLKYEIMNLNALRDYTVRKISPVPHASKNNGVNSLSTNFGDQFLEKVNQDSVKDRSAIINSKKVEDRVTVEQMKAQDELMKWFNSAERKMGRIELHKKMIAERLEQASWAADEELPLLEEPSYTQDLTIKTTLSDFSGSSFDLSTPTTSEMINVLKQIEQKYLEREEYPNMNWMNSAQRKMALIEKHKSMIDMMWIDRMPENELETIGSMIAQNAISSLFDSANMEVLDSGVSKKVEREAVDFDMQRHHMTWMNSEDRKMLKIQQHQFMKDMIEIASYSVEMTETETTSSNGNSLKGFSGLIIEPVAAANLEFSKEDQEKDYSMSFEETKKNGESLSLNYIKNLQKMPNFTKWRAFSL